MLSNNEMLLNFMLILIKVDEAQGDGKIAITDLTLLLCSASLSPHRRRKDEIF